MKHSLVWMMTALTLMASNALAYNNPHILEVDLSIEGVDDPDEVSPGGFVAKDGLKKITLRYTGVNLPTKTRLNWDSAKIKVDGLPDGTDEIYWDPASDMPTQLWVRGVAASDTGPEGTNGGPEHLCLEAINNGTPYLYDRIAFTVYEVTNILVIPKGMTTNDTLPDPVTIGAGAMDSEAHQADVEIQVAPAAEGMPVDVSLIDGRGHDAGKDAKLVMGTATATGGCAAVTVLTGAGGQIQGVLTSSDVEDGLACKIHAGLIDRPVQFTWDRYPEAAQWTNVQEYLPFPGVLTNYVVLRHHRKPDACTPTNPAPYRPFIDHEIHFFVEQVEYWDTNGVLCVTNNTPPVSGGLSAFAAFVQEAYTTDGGGQVVPLLQVYTNYDISSVTMVGYDYSVWDTAAVSGAGAGGSGGTAGSLQEGGGGSGGLTPQQASPTAGHPSSPGSSEALKVDIEQSETNVCACPLSVVLALTQDSVDATWTCTPNSGLQGVETTARTYSFNPSISTAGTYVVKAVGLNFGALSDVCTVRVARLSFNDINAIRYNRVHWGDVDAANTNKITLTIEGDLGPGREVYVNGNLFVDFSDPANPGGTIDSRNVTATTTFDLIPRDISSTAGDRKIQAGIVPAGGGVANLGHYCTNDQFISYAYYLRGFATNDVVLQRKDTTNYCAACNASWSGAGDPPPSPPSDGHTGTDGATQPHPIHDTNWDSCWHCAFNCGRAVSVMLGLAVTQDSVMKPGTTNLAQNHMNGPSIPELENMYGVTPMDASWFLPCYEGITRGKGIREKDAYGVRTTMLGGEQWGHAYLVDGAKKNDEAGIITPIEYHTVDPWTGELKWRSDVEYILLQP